MKYTINLLPQPEKSLSDKIVYFSFHYLRYILVITQFVVICVFFYRFRVDQQIVDLKEALRQKRQIIDSTQTLLNEVEVVDSKIILAKEIITEQDRVNEMITYFFSQIPPSFRVSGITILPDSVEFQGETNNIDSIQVFYDTLNKESRFK